MPLLAWIVVLWLFLSFISFIIEFWPYSIAIVIAGAATWFVTKAYLARRGKHLLCVVGLHKWNQNQCQCLRCGKKRDLDHISHLGISGCKCHSCGAIRGPDHKSHSWSGLHGCKCYVCGTTRDGPTVTHTWVAHSDLDQCSSCKATRKHVHQWQGCRCAVCKEIRDSHHEWDIQADEDRCRVCGKTRNHEHAWQGCQCTTCHATRADDHPDHAWCGCKCKVCGAVRPTDHPSHDWSEDCLRCPNCGAVRRTAHDWVDGKCQRCGKTQRSLNEELAAAALKGDAELVKRLALSGADPNALDGRGRTPLHAAADGGDPAVVRLLIDNGAVVDSTMDGMTPAFFAARRGRLAALNVLVDKGANLHLVDSGGKTILHYAAGMGHHHLVRYLLSQGVSTEARDHSNYTPLDAAIHFGRLRTIDVLRGTDRYGRVGVDTSFEPDEIVAAFCLSEGPGLVEILDALPEPLLRKIEVRRAIQSIWLPLWIVCRRGEHSEVASRFQLIKGNRELEWPRYGPGIRDQSSRSMDAEAQ
jgi:hypothetical protein